MVGGEEVPDTSTNDSPNLAHSQLIFIYPEQERGENMLYTYFSTSVYTKYIL
jgi:hypothetical protein